PIYLFLPSHTPPPQSSPLSLHDALPICLDIDVRVVLGLECDIPRIELHERDPRGRPQCCGIGSCQAGVVEACQDLPAQLVAIRGDRKSTRLNSSHVKISYAVFCLKKKKI